jgi:hypothetical protein
VATKRIGAAFLGALAIGAVAAGLLLRSPTPTFEPAPATAPDAGACAVAAERAVDAIAPLASTDAVSREVGGADATPPRGGVPVAVAAIGETERPAGAYPWTESDQESPPETEAAHVYAGFHLDLDLDDEPLLAVLARLNARGLPPITVDPTTLREIEAEQLRVKLKVRDITAANALNLILCCREGFVADFRENDLLVHEFEPPTADRDPQRLPIRRIFAYGPPRPPVVPRWAQDFQARLAQVQCTCDFRDASLDEAIQLLQEKTDVNITLSKAIDGDAVRVTGHFDDRPASEVLDAVLADAGLVTTFRNETLQIVPRDELKQEEPPELPSKRVTVAFRAATLPDLVAVLARQGVPSLVSPEGWDARGTFSLTAEDVTVAELSSRIAAVAPLTAWTIPAGGHIAQETFVIAGALPSVRQALELEVSPRLAGVVAEVAELRARLADELLARETARGDPLTSAAALATSELAVDRTAAAILRRIERARLLQGARDRRARSADRLAELGPGHTQATVDLELAARRPAGDDATIEKLKAELRLQRVDAEIAKEHVTFDATGVDIRLLERLERGERLPIEAP